MVSDVAHQRLTLRIRLINVVVFRQDVVLKGFKDIGGNLHHALMCKTNKLLTVTLRTLMADTRQTTRQ